MLVLIMLGQVIPNAQLAERDDLDFGSEGQTALFAPEILHLGLDVDITLQRRFKRAAQLNNRIAAAETGDAGSIAVDLEFDRRVDPIDRRWRHERPHDSSSSLVVRMESNRPQRARRLPGHKRTNIGKNLTAVNNLSQDFAAVSEVFA